MPRKRRLETSFLEDCMDVLDGPTMNPKIRRIGDGRSQGNKHAKLCADTRAIYEAMAPVIDDLSRAIE